ncbi:MAG TPA: gliding motility-associated C-terminal domain-containing protein, partial [Chitinophagales bacterium]|nr:gliding motility-associated C-terminal domain-containing protein [Chitinophagales bacterium]
SAGMISGLGAGTFAVTVTDVNNCSVSDSATLVEPDSVEVTVSPSPVEVKLGESLQLTATTNQTGTLTYLWDPQFGLSCYDCADPTFNGVYSQPYTLTVTNQDGCNGTAQFVVTVVPDYTIFLPNAFTPNGDGNNDYWQLFGKITAIKQFEVMVFDRIGEKVFDSNDVNFKWDGTYKGKPAPEGIYSYIVKIVWLNNHSDNAIKGSITLLR